MNREANAETLGFQTEVRQLLDLMVHSLYGNKEIFLRELISNASDAADRLRFEALRDAALLEDEPELGIRIEYNREQKTLSVVDNGIGMSRDEIVRNLGTIARSGTREFFNALTGDQARDSRLIGQFGVGFYSAFIVAHTVEVASRRAGLPRGEGVRWVSKGEGEFTVETVDRPRRGTRITLHLRDGEDEFLDGARLRSVIRRYSDHISLPILMAREGKDARGEETVNSATALWARPKKEISEAEYREFYKHVSHDFEDPLAWAHNRVEGKSEYTTLLYIPKRAPFDLWDRERRHGVKLYVKRVFIMDDAEQLLPASLRFVRGVVDSDDLPLNVSREILQQNRLIETIRSGCVRRVLELLQSLANNEPARYAEFWKEFGRVLKEGVIDMPDRRAELAAMFRFASTHGRDDAQDVSLRDYVGRMREGQKAIWYLTADSASAARGSPHLEVFREHGIEVLLLTDPVDEWLVMHLTEFEGKPIASVARGDLSLGDLGVEEAQAPPPPEGTPKDLIARISKCLGERVAEVRASRRLTDSASCLVAGADGMSRNLERILQAAGQKLPAGKPVLEVNMQHPLVLKAAAETDAGRFADWAELLYEEALLGDGGQLPDPAEFVSRLNRLLLGAAGRDPG
jgi:molecular chaperone HtpG